MEGDFSIALLNISPQEWGLYISLFWASFVKFALAAFAALLDEGLSFPEMFLTVGMGALVSVVVYTYFGRQLNLLIRRVFKRKKPISFARRRRMYLFWKKYGMAGAAFLAPVISPMASVGIAVSFQEKPRRIILYTSLSIIGWTVIFYLFKTPVQAALLHAKEWLGL